MTLYNIYYIGSINGDDKDYEVTTDNFNKWFKEHNLERWAEVTCGDDEDQDHIDKECTCIESKKDFIVEPIALYTYGNSVKYLIKEYQAKKKKLLKISSPIMGYQNGVRDGKIKQLIIIIEDLKKIICT